MNREIYATLKDRILFMEYAPGYILNEKVLADEFNMSRTPLREVLMRLEWDKLVRILPRAGALVTEIEFYQMMNTYQVRFEVEGLVGRLAAENHTPADLEAMAAVAGRCRDLHDERNERSLVAVDIAFRDVMLGAANNAVLADTSVNLYTITQRLWFSTLGRGDWDDEVDCVHQEIIETRDTWTAGDPLAAGQYRKNTLIRHFEQIRDKFLGEFRR